MVYAAKKESEGLLALFVVVGFPAPCASAIVSVRLPSPVPSCGRRLCKVPVRVRFRSDKHAAVLRLQRTQPKDRRVYDAPYRILSIAGAGCGTKGDLRSGQAAHSLCGRKGGRNVPHYPLIPLDAIPCTKNFCPPRKIISTGIKDSTLAAITSPYSVEY